MSESTQTSASETPNSSANHSTSRQLALVGAIALLILGWLWDNNWLIVPGMISVFSLSWSVVVSPVQLLYQRLKPLPWIAVLAWFGSILTVLSGLKLLGVGQRINERLTEIKWDEFGSWGEWFGALGQILIAVIAVYVAWRQYVISRDLTIQQNLITQQQTIDTYF